MSNQQKLDQAIEAVAVAVEHRDALKKIIEDNFGAEARRQLLNGRLLIAEQAIRSEVMRFRLMDGVLKELHCTPDGVTLVVQGERHGAAIETMIRLQIQKLVLTETLQTLVLSVTEEKSPIGKNFLGRILCFIVKLCGISLTNYVLKNITLNGYVGYDKPKKLLTVGLGQLPQVKWLLQPQVPSWPDSFPLSWLKVKGVDHVFGGIELQLAVPRILRDPIVGSPPSSPIPGNPVREVDVADINGVKEAVKARSWRITVKGRKAKHVHRALRGMHGLVQGGMKLERLDLTQVAAMLIKAGVGPKTINAIVNKVGPQLSYALSANYREVQYVKPDDDSGDDHGKCVLELND